MEKKHSPSDNERGRANSTQSDEASDESSEVATPGGSREMFCGLLSSVVRSLGRRRKKSKKRQESVSVSYTPQNGLMVQVLGASEVAGGQGEESSASSGGRMEPDEGGRNIFLPRIPSFTGGQEAEERLISRASGRSRPPTSGPRFLTLHRRRRRRPPTRGLLANAALLDDIYNGPTQSSTVWTGLRGVCTVALGDALSFACLMPALCLLNRVSLWDFNAFALDSVCGGRPVAVLCVFLLHEYGLLRQFGLEAVAVWKCFCLIEDGYHSSNPYHNAIHAADVTQAMHCFLQEVAILENLTPLEKLAALIAAVCHDVDHPGVNQPFLIATDNHLAVLYNNASVLENHHWRCAMGCLWESGFLKGWSKERISLLQEMIRSLILATDITRQNEFLIRFRRYQETQSLDMRNAECRHFSLQIALKCADICNPCRPWGVSRQWSHKICEEFYRQGDFERQLQLPVTPTCDRYLNSVAKIQTGFIKMVVGPLFRAWDNWLHTVLSGAMVGFMESNLAKWDYFLREETRVLAGSASMVVTPVEVGPSSRASSSASSASVLGSLEAASYVPECLPGVRRYSLPLSIPSNLPRTVIRRESLTETGHQPAIVLKTLITGKNNTVSFSMEREIEEELYRHDDSPADDNFFPDPTITAMGEVGPLRTHPLAKASRRQSLPPLWSRIVPLQHVPPTPLQEEGPAEEEKPLQSKGCAEEAGGEESQGPSGGKAEGEGDSNSANKYNSVERRSSSMRMLLEWKEEARNRLSLSDRSVRRGSSLDSYSSGIKLLEMEVDVPKLSRIEGDLSASEKAAKCIPLDVPRRSSIFGKENMVPSHEKRSSTALLKTKMWKSLNHEEDRGRRGSSCRSVDYQHLKGRRGSAPLLRYEGSPRGHGEYAVDYLPRRRGSAPSNHLGYDTGKIPSQEERLMHVPLLALENCHGEEKGSWLILRRSSGPAESRGGAGNQGNPTHGVVGSKMQSGGFVGGDLTLTHQCSEGWLSDIRRGSSGLELLSGMWRIHLDQNFSSLCSDDSVSISSSGGATPGSPGTVGLSSLCQMPATFLPTLFYRRSSLPTEVYTADTRKWSLGAS